MRHNGQFDSLLKCCHRQNGACDIGRYGGRPSLGTCLLACFGLTALHAEYVATFQPATPYRQPEPSRTAALAASRRQTCGQCDERPACRLWKQSPCGGILAHLGAVCPADPPQWKPFSVGVCDARD